MLSCYWKRGDNMPRKIKIDITKKSSIKRGFKQLERELQKELEKNIKKAFK